MRTLLFVLVSIAITLTHPVQANGSFEYDTLAALKKEVAALFKRNHAAFPEISSQDVTVGFLLNAKNEIIVLDVEGDNTEACDYVKEVLHFRKVKFSHAKQLTRYQVTIQLVRDTA